MRKILFGLLLLLAVSAAEAQEFRALFKSRSPSGSELVLRRTQASCTNQQVRAALALAVSPELLRQFKRSILTWEGRDWESCWIERDGYVYSMDEAGELLQPVPEGLFRSDDL